MKKKGLFVTLLLLVAIVASIALTGCSLVELNEERQANRIIATVSDTIGITNEKAKAALDELGISDYTVTIDITRRELLSNANYTINYYSQLYSAYGMQYSYELDDVLDDTLEAMLSEKYYIIRGIENLLNNADSDRLSCMYMVCEKDEYLAKFGHKITTEGVLTLSEWYNSFSTVNKSLQSMLDGYVKNEQTDTRNEEISDADDKISEAYEKGYFFSSVAVARKNDEGKFEKGLYQDSFIVVPSSDSETATKEIDYNKVYAEITLTKSGEEDIVVYRPVSDTNLTLSAVEDADFIGKYVSTKEAKVSYIGRVFAEKTEENDKGYEMEEKTSDAVEYKAVTARSAYSEPEEEEKDYLQVSLYRYASKQTWDAFKATFDAKENDFVKTETFDAYVETIRTANAETKNIDEICDNMFDALKSLYGKAFDTVYNGTDAASKEGYRQLRSTLSSANIGYKDGKSDEEDKYYHGLISYYDEQFMSNVLSAVKFELGEKVQILNGNISAMYKAKVLQDKVKYENKGLEAQVTEFFKDSDKAISDLTGIYYVPVEALQTTFTVDPKNKSYAPLFTFDGEGNVETYNETYVTKNGDDYEMKYIYDNGDGTYTINAFFVGHILFSFDNSEDISSYLVGDGTTTAIDIYNLTDMPYEKQLNAFRLLVDYLKTNRQNLSYTEEGGDALEDVFAVDEEGNLIMENVEDVITAINAELVGKDYETVLKGFLDYMKQYNDDSGAINGSGYLIADVDTGFMQDFTETARALYYGMLNDGVAPNAYESATEDMFKRAYTVYGMHYEFVAFAPLYRVQLEEVEEGVFALKQDAKLNLDGDTHYDEIGKDLRSDAIANAYNEWKADFTEEKIKEKSTTDQKAYDKLVKELTEKK